MRRCAALLFLTSACYAAPNAAEIMARVAQNQDRAEKGRARYVYSQTTAIRIRDTHNRLTREELTKYEMFPGPDGTQRKEVFFTGKYRQGKQLLPYAKSGEPMIKDSRSQADAHMAHNLRDQLTATKRGKDGLSPHLFPLTSREQTHYDFQLKGELVIGSIPVYSIAFQPKKGEELWAGEALISRQDFEPVQVSTKLAHGVPFLVRTMLGTNLRGLGFTVSYRKLDDGIWFPASYGTEFDVRVVFVYSRKISISLINTDFKRTESDTSITFEK